MGDIKAMLSKKLFHVRAHTTPCCNVFWGNSVFTNGSFAGPERSKSKALSQTSWWWCVTHPLPVSGRVLMGTGSSLAPHDIRLGWTLGKENNGSPQLLAKERSWSSSLALVYLWQKWSVWLRVNVSRKTFHAPTVPSHLSGREQSNTPQRFLSFEIDFDTAIQWLTSSWPFSLFTMVSFRILLDVVSLMVWLVRPKSRKLSLGGGGLSGPPTSLLIVFLVPHLLWKIPDRLKWLSMSFSKQTCSTSFFLWHLSKDICWRLTDFVLISFLGIMEMIVF